MTLKKVPFVRREEEAAAHSLAHPEEVGPPFCLETAAKALAGSTVVYLEPNSRGMTQEKYDEMLSFVNRPLVPGGASSSSSEVGSGADWEVLIIQEFYNRKGLHTVRCLCIALKPPPGNDNSDSTGTIRVIFRGTDTFGNVIADAKALRVPHPPKRGIPLWSEPSVHRGFLEAWRGDGLKAAVEGFVLQYAKELQKEADARPVVVDIQGHSLGGSIAALAAYDLANALKEDSESPKDSENNCPAIRLTTFGCPRVGNHAFVKDFNKVVPSCWNVINDNDVVPAVPHSPRILRGYLRHGRSVIIREDGTMTVQPSRREKRARERRVLKLGSATKAHETGGYRRSLRAVFEKEGLLDPEGSSSTPEIRALDERLGILDKIVTEARADPNRSIRILPGAT